MSWAEHERRWRTCERCDLHKHRKQAVLGMGRIQHGDHPGAPVFAVGQFPGEDEDRCGLPMQGKGGQWVYWAITQLAGLSWDDCFFTNILACKPPTNKSRVAYVNACSSRIDEVLALVRPRIILSMGKVASCYFSGDNSATISKLAGKRGRYGLYEVFFTHHPFEPERQKTVPGKQESERKIMRDYAGFRNRCIEIGLLEREIE